MAQIYDSRHTGQEMDKAVDDVQTAIPAQLATIGLKIDEVESNIESMIVVESTAVRERHFIINNVYIDGTGKVVSLSNRRLIYIHLLKGIYKVSLTLNSSILFACALFDDVPATNSQASKVVMLKNTPNSEEQLLVNVEEDSYVAFSNYATMGTPSVVKMANEAYQNSTVFNNTELSTTEEGAGDVLGTVGGSISIGTNQNYYHKQYDVSALDKVFIRLKTNSNKGIPFVFLIDENDIIQYRYIGYTVATLIEEYLDVHSYSKIAIQYYRLGDYFGSLSQVNEIPVKDVLQDVQDELQDFATEKQIYGKGDLLQDGYLPNAFINGSKIVTGSSYYYRIKYAAVSQGDVLLLKVTDTTAHIRGIYISQSVPDNNVAVEEILTSDNDIDTLFKATQDGYVLVYFYATGNGYINEASLPSEYTDEAIENLVRPYPAYYESYIEGKLQSFYDVNKVNSRQSDSFVFITDIHLGRNMMQSPKLIEGIMQRSVISKVFFGGDIPYSQVATRAELYQYWRQFLEFYNRINPLGMLFNVRGNHEWNNYVQDEEAWIDLPKSEIYATLMDKYNPNLLVHQGDNMEYPCYYYVDNSHAKIRYIILDGSGNNAVVEGNYAQGAWLKNTLNETPAGYDVIVFSHIALTDVVWTTPIADYMYLLKQANSRQGDFVNCQCTVKAVFSGHSHYDFQNWDGDILCIVTNCDYYGDAAYYPVNDVSSSSVRWGYGHTVLEQSFDVCNIDFGNNVINLIKIGFGPSRRIHLSPISMSVSGTNTMETTISGTVSWYSYNADSAFSKTSLVNDVVSIDETTGLITALKAGSAVVMAKNTENSREFWEIVVS